MTQICKIIGNIILIGHPKVKSSRVRINLLKRELMAFVDEHDDHTLWLKPYALSEKRKMRDIDFMETGYNGYGSLFCCKLVEVDNV